MKIIAVKWFVTALLGIQWRGFFVLLLALPVCAEQALNMSGVDAVAAQQLIKTDASTEQPNSSPLPTTNQVNAHAVVQSNYPTTSGVQTNAITPIGSGRHLLNVTLALLGIVGLIVAISWFVKRVSGGTFSANTHIKLISAMPLGTRERIVLIDAGGQQLLLGITPTHINTLHVFETPIAMEGKPESQSDFSRKLMAILQQKTSPLSTPGNNNNATP